MLSVWGCVNHIRCLSRCRFFLERKKNVKSLWSIWSRFVSPDHFFHFGDSWFGSRVAAENSWHKEVADAAPGRCCSLLFVWSRVVGFKHQICGCVNHYCMCWEWLIGHRYSLNTRMSKLDLFILLGMWAEFDIWDFISSRNSDLACRSMCIRPGRKFLIMASEFAERRHKVPTILSSLKLWAMSAGWINDWPSA